MNMNASKIIVRLIRKSYGDQRRWRRRSNPGIQKRLDVLEDEPSYDFETVENLDIDNTEPDFMKSHESYSAYKKELTKNKDLLKLRIVTRKYFKEVEPSLLTYVEKEQIRFLHQSDTLEYTPEKLSESFPALPHTIRKILKATWTPRSADKVIKHDEKVIENWKRFKRGELLLEPRLREHLEKFKGRIVNLPSKEELEEKFLPPEKNFQKPKSQLYSGIIKKFLDQKKESREEEETIDSINKNNRTDFDDARFDRNDLTNKHSSSDFKEDFNDERFGGQDSTERQNSSGRKQRMINPRYRNEVAVGNEEKSLKIVKIKDPKLKEKDFFTLDKFFEDRVKSIDSECSSSIEDKVLLDTYKRKIESNIVKENKNIDNVDQKNIKHREFDSATILTEKDLQIGIKEGIKAESVKVVDASKELGLETYVKVWEKKASDDEDYPEVIRIPKAKYKKGKLYKVKDCYYDHDGEFLYRVPGLVD